MIRVIYKKASLTAEVIEVNETEAERFKVWSRGELAKRKDEHFTLEPGKIVYFSQVINIDYDLS
ncbi:hypothetical protein H7992_07095 [Sporosarcina sp. resist]|uniref:hypothetical protein n=1 Tax=Sporosarcina sp. resist TaxID=2762563 RepID=UPI00164D29D6|nr:hypothetical protein [Sporosarcina sp. resist]QNK89424.1 hypothetical protein H7992_07095 [Sporosarcina sp. resist]